MNSRKQLTESAIFEKKVIRKLWENERWYYSVADVIGAISTLHFPDRYWKRMKHRNKDLRWIKKIFQTLDEKIISVDFAEKTSLRIIIALLSSESNPDFLKWLEDSDRELPMQKEDYYRESKVIFLESSERWFKYSLKLSGVNGPGSRRILKNGDLALFNGDPHQLFELRKNEDLNQSLNSLLLAAKSFVITVTEFLIEKRKIRGERDINQTYKSLNADIRKIIRPFKPEEMPLERKLVPLRCLR